MNTPQKQAGLVWDIPVRIFHWSLVLCFIGAWLTAESEYWKLWHLSFGYSMGALILFRLIWGMLGTRYARFSQFIKGPTEIKAYLQSYGHGAPKHYVGHNPAGALAILAILFMIALTVASGYANYEELGGEWLSELHEAVASLLLAIVVLHIAAVLITSVLQKENLIRAMLTGKKMIDQDEAIERSWPSIGLLLLGGLAALWWFVFR